MANLSRANSSASGTTATVSAWVKKVDTSGDEGIFQFKTGNDQIAFYINPIVKFRSNISGGTSNGILESNRKIRDFSGWFHVVGTIDTTNATAGDRLRVYVNGERVTSWGTETYPSQNYSFTPVSGGEFQLGKYTTTDAPTYLAHVHYCDGYAYNADSFGSTDSTTGEWKINTQPNVQYGSNGVFLKFASSGAMGTDSSGNNNTMSISGSCIQTQDNPSNNFCTFNPLFRQVDTGTSKGNTKFETTSGSGWKTMCGTLGMEKNTGKYYMEFKNLGGNVGFGIADYTTGGVVDKVNRATSTYAGNNANSYGYLLQGEFFYNGSYTASGWASYTTNDIIGMAVDMENMKIYFHKNGTYQNSGNPTAGSGGYTIADPVGAYLPVGSVNAGILCANFGNGYFETTAISSEGTNASNIGKFEYDVPTGFTALSTKGLNL